MNSFFKDFQARIIGRKIKIAIVGLGYVGLPLAIEFAESGFKVIGIDLDKDRLNHIRKKESYITDVSSLHLKRAVNSGRLAVSNDFSTLKEVDVVIICVPTPLKRKYSPNISHIIQAVKLISKHIKKGSLVILESTTYPGTTEDVILPLLEGDGFKQDKDFYLVFSPERIDPGNKNYPINKIPKIVGGASFQATKLAELVYKNIIDEVVPVSTARAAESVKLLENTFRLVNIALIDELTMMAHKMNIDIWEVIKAASTKPFGFMPFYPGPGVGGHCIPKDPLYLYWKARHFGSRLRLVKAASDIITQMPGYVVERVREILKVKNIRIANSKILVVGVTYKKDIKDLRKSPGLDIIEILQEDNARVAYFDPLIPYLKLDHIQLKSIELRSQKLAQFDCVIIATDQTCIDYGFLLKHSSLIFDTRNVYKNTKDERIILI